MKKLHRWTVSVAILAAFFIACSPASAQWQVPTGAIPLGKGTGTGFGTVGGSAGAGAKCLLDSTPPAFGTCPGGGGTPGGSNLQVQYNNAGAFGGLTDVQLTARIQAFTSVLSGAAPASGGGTTNFLRADGTWTTTPVNYVATIAALKALTVPANGTPYYVQGYTASGDGGEGWFVYNSASAASDNAGTIIQPNVGSGRWLRNYVGSNGNKINVKWFGAKGDAVTSDTTPIQSAMTVAIAIHGSLYFPATSGCYVTSFTVPDGTTGLTIEGDSKGVSPVLSNGGSYLCNSTANPTLKIQSATGAIGVITVRNLKITNSAGDALFIDRGNFFNIDDLTLQSTTDYALHIKGSGNMTVKDVQAYGGANAALRIEDSPTVTVSGPISFVNGQYSVQGGNATTAISISGDSFSVSFYNTMYAGQGPNMAASVTIDGSTGAPGSPTHPGTITFIGVHGESNYNSSANTGVDFLIGNTTKAGSVVINNASAFGQGNGTSYQNDFIKIVAAKSVTVVNSNVTNLGATNGYNRSMIRMETTFPASTDKYTFANNQFLGGGSSAMYSDANGNVSTSWNGSFISAANIKGTATNDSACTGCLGETLSASVASGSAVALTTSTAATVTSITLTPGDWDVRGSCGFATGGSGTTSVTRVLCSLSGNTNTLDTTIGRFTDFVFPAFVPSAGAGSTIWVGPERFSVSVNTTVFLVAFSTFTVSTNSAYGKISARRVR